MIMAAIMAIPAFADKDVEVKPTMTLKLYPYRSKNQCRNSRKWRFRDAGPIGK